jgi:hypothetical protein
MNWYSADIDTWERGKTVRFQARNHQEALKVAGAYGEVVQLRVNVNSTSVSSVDGTLIWDKWNGPLH